MGEDARPLSDISVPDFEVVEFQRMADLIELPVVTVVLLFAPGTFASKVFLPTMQDISEMLRANGVPIAVVALDLTGEAVPEAFSEQYPPALAPYLQIVLPRAAEGEPGV